jgi:hypothetical protein
MVKHCSPIITCVFHVDGKSTNNKYCFCLCNRATSDSTVAGSGRAICGMENIVKQYKRGPLMQKAAPAFVDHVRSKKGSCGFHQVMHEFLEELCGNFQGPAKVCLLGQKKKEVPNLREVGSTIKTCMLMSVTKQVELGRGCQRPAYFRNSKNNTRCLFVCLTVVAPQSWGYPWSQMQ